MKQEKKIMTFIMLICSLFFVSCWGDEFEKEKIAGNYYLMSSDSYNNDVSISYKLESGGFAEIIGQTVFAIGHNDRYIVVGQHSINFKNQNVYPVTNYYIMKISDNVLSAENGVTGPLNINEYELKKKELHIDNLSFSRKLEPK